MTVKITTLTAWACVGISVTLGSSGSWTIRDYPLEGGVGRPGGAAGVYLSYRFQNRDDFSRGPEMLRKWLEMVISIIFYATRQLPHTPRMGLVSSCQTWQERMQVLACVIKLDFGQEL
jgi:hypothetical protein